MNHQSDTSSSSFFPSQEGTGSAMPRRISVLDEVYTTSWPACIAIGDKGACILPTPSVDICYQMPKSPHVSKINVAYIVWYTTLIQDCSAWTITLQQVINANSHDSGGYCKCSTTHIAHRLWEELTCRASACMLCSWAASLRAFALIKLSHCPYTQPSMVIFTFPDVCMWQGRLALHAHAANKLYI